MTNVDNITDDTPVWGASEIGKLLNRSRRQIYHLLETGVIDARKIGGTWVSTRARLLRSLQQGGRDAAA